MDKNYSSTFIKRAVAFIIDWNLIFIICFTILLSGPNFDVEYLARPSIRMFSFYNVIFGLLSFILFPLIKDILFRNASLGKVIMGLRVVDAETGTPPSLINLILRNVTFYFPPIGMISYFANGGKTLGDMIAKTTVISKRKKN